MHCTTRNHKPFSSKSWFFILLSSFLQTDPLEHHFGLYRMTSGSNYHLSYPQILETERRLKLSSVLNIFFPTIQLFLHSDIHQSFTSLDNINIDDDDDFIILDPFLEYIGDLSSIECSTQVLQSLAFIAGYAVHKYLKHHQLCHVCLDALTFEKEFLFDPDFPSEFKLLQLTDRGRLKYPSEPVLSVVIILWKIFVLIESDDKLLTLLVEGSSRKILVQLTLIFLGEIADNKIWRSNCVNCDACRWKIVLYLLQQIVLLQIKFKITTHY